jgi:hypothetical protein
LTSPRGYAAAAIFLLALPIAALFQLVIGGGAEAALHFMLALGAALLAVALGDFRAPRFAAWLGRVSLGALGAIFLLQGVALVSDNAALSHVAFQVLGQSLEGWLVAGFLFWCSVLLLVDSRGKTRLFGVVAIGLTVSTRILDFVYTMRGASMGATWPGLKLLYLVPFVWLLLESRKRRVAIT